MNKEELKATLQKEGFKEQAYSLEQEKFDPDEALCLRHEQGKWSVYYSERGLQTGKLSFDGEEEACDYFIGQMRDDPTTKKDWKSGYSWPLNK
jgi:hypothetical protein